MPVRINRRYVDIQGRRVHFRSAGTGPVVLLLHQSPQSSAAMMPLAEKLVSRYCVVAPDSPGFGLSDPLPMEEPGIEDIADALDEFTDAIHLPPAVVMGVHTGAEIALEFGLRYPEKVTFLLLDGLALFTGEESEEILENYLPPFTPDWDGSHLTWLWARLREQVIFFPWYRKDPGSRMNYNVPDADYIHSWFMDFMYAGDNYRGGYGAAFRYCNSSSIKDVIPPGAALYRTGDVLETHRQRLPELPDHVWAETVPPGPGKLDDRIIDLLGEWVADNQPDWHFEHRVCRSGVKPEPDYISIGERQIAVTRAGDPSTPLLLVLHDLAGSAAATGDLVSILAETHHVICPDLPGHGESDVPADGGFSISAAAAGLSELLNLLEADHCRILSLGAGCVLLPPLIRDNPEINFHAGMHNPLLLDTASRAALHDRFAHPIEPDDYGTHITRLWYALRDGRLFWPWYEPVAGNIRRHTPSLAAGDIHQSLFDALRCGKSYHRIWQAFFSTDVVKEIKALPQPLSATMSNTHPCAEDALSLLAQLPTVTCRETSDDWSEVIDVHFS